KPIYELPYADARAVLASVQADTVAASAATSTQDLIWKMGPTGQVRVRIVRPADAKGALPAVLYYHGGGWVMGDRKTHDHLIRELAVQARAAVVFVEYDNAPEVRYPVNNEQAYAALEYVAAHGAALGIDATRLAVAGDSAGGNMAAVTAIQASRDGGPAPVMQFLIYPSADRATMRPSRERFADGYFLTEAERQWYDAHYMSGEHERSDWRHSPLHAPDLSGLPPAVVVTAAFDPLRDEGEAYARALESAGNRVVLQRVAGQIHGFINMTGFSPSARSAYERAVRAAAAWLQAP
ncbi:MAG: alpha/beta hydrolase, partial [Candidatus Sericytochromatia bacterium]